MKVIQFIGDGEAAPDILHCEAANGIDYTLCGVSLDNDTATIGTHKIVKAPCVTCPECIAIILHCRGKRITTA